MHFRYVLMLLGDPGAPRDELLRILESAQDVRPASGRAGCYLLRAGEAEIELLFGSKDPVESIHCEFARGSDASLLGIARRLLALASDLGMYVEDVQWGRELNEPVLDEWIAHWRTRQIGPAAGPLLRIPWWRRILGSAGDN